MSMNGQVADVLRAEYERGYNDGFDRGTEAMAQQIEGVMNESLCATAAAIRVSEMLEEFWKERES